MKRCMIVDDSSVIRKVARRILGGSGMIVAEAANGQHALAICEAEMPEIIIVDASLPDMSAVEFVSRAMAAATDFKPRIVVSMTQVDLATIMRTKRAGARGYVLKPFNRPQLLERFREMELAA